MYTKIITGLLFSFTLVISHLSFANGGSTSAVSP